MGTLVGISSLASVATWVAGSTSHAVSEEPIVALANVAVVEAIRRAGNAASSDSVQFNLADALDSVPAFVGGADLTDAID